MSAKSDSLVLRNIEERSSDSHAIQKQSFNFSHHLRAFSPLEYFISFHIIHFVWFHIIIISAIIWFPAAFKSVYKTFLNLTIGQNTQKATTSLTLTTANPFIPTNNTCHKPPLFLGFFLMVTCILPYPNLNSIRFFKNNFFL